MRILRWRLATKESWEMQQYDVPRPHVDIGERVLALASAGEVFTVFQADLQHTEQALCLVHVAYNSVRP